MGTPDFYPIDQDLSMGALDFPFGPVFFSRIRLFGQVVHGSSSDFDSCAAAWQLPASQIL
jgi:hypothetical protein